MKDTFAEKLLEKLGEEKLHKHIDQLERNLKNLTEGMQKITLLSIERLKNVLIKSK